VGGAFAGRTVIITGASAGVGAASARAFAAAGARLVLVARGAEGLAGIAAELARTTQVLSCPLDVADRAGCDRMLAAAAERFARLDVLVNNAGYHQRGPVRAVEAAALARMVEVNLAAPVYLCRAVLPYFEAAGGGAIVNVASLAGRTPLTGAAVCSANKFGLRAFSRALAEELRPAGVSVSVVSPGPVRTGFILDDIDAVEDITFSQPMSTPEQVAAAILRAAAGPGGEICLPRRSGVLTMLAYVFPALARALRPALQRKGARIKARYKAR